VGKPAEAPIRAIALNTTLLQLAAAGLAILLYVLGLVAVKWWGYPGWTWRGYVTDLEAVVGLLVFASGFGFWLFQLYRTRSLEEAVPPAVRRLLLSERLPLAVGALLLAASGLSVALLVVGECPVGHRLVLFAQQSNWKHAREHLHDLMESPLRKELVQTFTLFIDVHELSERDRLTGSSSLREDRQRVEQLLEEGHDAHLFNSLSHAELSKTIYFIEDAGARKTEISRAIERLERRLVSLTDELDRATLLARIGELHLADRNYSAAHSFFEQSLRFETRKTPTARLRSNLGNVYAARRDLRRATELYAEAESNYPEGRRAVFYSNFGYLLMLASDYDAAKQKVERALQIEPTDWYSYLNLGLIKERLGAYDDAYEDFKTVIARSDNQDSRREARILAGRCLELQGRPESEYLPFYLEADGRSTSPAQILRVQKSVEERAELYSRMASLLESTNTHAIEPYVEWFGDRAAELVRQHLPSQTPSADVRSF
jgi:tetratricopeptide (TPR) repeat protein